MKIRNTRRAVSLLMAMLLLLAVISAPGTAQARTEKELQAEIDQIEERIQAKQKEIDQLRTQQGEQEKLLVPLQQQVEEVEAKARLIDQEIDRLVNEANQINAKIRAIEKQVGEIETRVAEIEDQTKAKLKEIQKMQKLLQERLRQQYMDGPVSNLQLLLSSPDLSSMLTITEYLSREAERDNQLRETLQKEMEQLRLLQEELEAQQAQLEQNKVELEKQNAVLVEKMVAQDKEKKKLDQQHKAIGAAQTEIFTIIDDLQLKTREANRIIARQKADQDKFERELDAMLAQKIQTGQVPEEINNSGRMIWPFPYPGCYLTSQFGDTSNRTTYHKGLDMSIKDKSKSYYIVAALEGVIVARGFDKYMGNYVTIYHGYYQPKGKYIKTTYMHMASFDSGAGINSTVKAGKVLGIMGSTGNSTGPHLHFQINEISGNTSTPVNPLLYVSKPY